MDTKKTPLSPLKNLAKAVTILLSIRLHLNKEPRRELEKILQTEGTIKTWYPLHHGPCDRDLRINTHLGAGGVMKPSRIQDPEEAKTFVISFKSDVGAILALYKQISRLFASATQLAADLESTWMTPSEENKTRQNKDARSSSSTSPTCT